MNARRTPIRLLPWPLVLVAMLAPSAGAVVSENFDSDPASGDPSGLGYTYTEGGPGGTTIEVQDCTSTSAPSLPNCLVIPADTSAATHYPDFEFESGDACSTSALDGDTLTWKFRLTNLPAAGGAQAVGGIWTTTTHHPSTADGVRIRVSDTGVATLVIEAPEGGSATSTISGVTIAAGTWYTATLKDFDCAVTNAPGETRYTACVNTSCKTIVGTNTIRFWGPGTTPIAGPLKHFGTVCATGTCQALRIDDITWTGESIDLDSIIVPEIFAVDDLTGASMDSNAGAIITREADGLIVKTYDPSDVAAGPTGSFTTDGCIGSDGVYAMFNGADYFTTFWDCDEDGDRNQLWVKDAVLQTPVFGNCGSHDLGQEEISSNDIDDDVETLGEEPFELPEEMNDLASFGDLNIDYSYCITNGRNEVLVAWGYTDELGRGGVYAVSIEDQPGDSLSIVNDRTSFQLDTSASPGIPGFCHWQDPEALVFGPGDDIVGDDWFAAAGGLTGPFAAWTADVVVQDDVASANDIDVELHLGFNNGNSGIYYGSTSLDCELNPVVGQDRNVTFVLGDNGRVRLLGYTHSGTPSYLNGTARATTAVKSTALSGNENWVAWLDGDYVKVAPTRYNTTETPHGYFDDVRAIIDAPPYATWVSMEFDSTGTVLMMATDSTLAVAFLGDTLCPDDTTGELCDPGANDSGETTGGECPAGQVGTFPLDCHPAGGGSDPSACVLLCEGDDDSPFGDSGAPVVRGFMFTIMMTAGGLAIGGGGGAAAGAKSGRAGLGAGIGAGILAALMLVAGLLFSYHFGWLLWWHIAITAFVVLVIGGVLAWFLGRR
jgi:hypothetical protein